MATIQCKYNTHPHTTGFAKNRNRQYIAPLLWLVKGSIGIGNDSKQFKEVVIVFVTNIFPSQGGLAVAAMNVRHSMKTSQQYSLFCPTTCYVHTTWERKRERERERKRERKRKRERDPSCATWLLINPNCTSYKKITRAQGDKETKH